jgi:hypothetical protein
MPTDRLNLPAFMPTHRLNLPAFVLSESAYMRNLSVFDKLNMQEFPTLVEGFLKNVANKKGEKDNLAAI